MKFKKVLLILLIILTTILLAIGSGAVIKREKFLNKLNIEKLDVSKYMAYTDEVSLSKAQANWKSVAAISSVLSENQPHLLSEEEIKYIAKLFLEQVNKDYKIKSIDEVISILETSHDIKLKDKQLERLNNYLVDLEHHGTKPERLNPDEKYIKFINTIKDDAIKNYEEHRILPSITIAQAILESSWGESKLSSEYNNLFGIKAHSSWEGDTVSVKTREFYDTTIVDDFRAYDNIGESLKDHAKFLKENPRYKKVFKKKTYSEQARELEKAGYSTATDEDGNLMYHDLLTQLIRQYNLQLIDSKVHER